MPGARSQGSGKERREKKKRLILLFATEKRGNLAILLSEKEDIEYACELTHNRNRWGTEGKKRKKIAANFI